MNPELEAALIGAVVGGLVGYAGGWLQQFVHERRQRTAIATAVLVELWFSLEVIRAAAAEIRDEDSITPFPIPRGALDRLSENVHLFKPKTVEAALVLATCLRNLDEVFAQTASLPRWPPALLNKLRRVYRTTIDVAFVTSDALLSDGAARPPELRPPNREELLALLAGDGDA